MYNSKALGHLRWQQPSSLEELRMTGFKKRFNSQDRFNTTTQQSLYPFVQARQVDILGKLANLTTSPRQPSRSLVSE